MDIKYFEILNSKIEEIVKYLNSKENEEIGRIFSQRVKHKTIIDYENYGSQIKISFENLKSRSKSLSESINNLSPNEVNFFLALVSKTQEKMEANLRSISLHISELEHIADSDGVYFNLFEIDRSFRDCYESFIFFVTIAQTSINILNKRIYDDLNPLFDFRSIQVDKLIADLKLYKGEASARKTKEIYKQKYQDYKRTVDVYEFYIMLLVCLSITLVIGQLFAHNFFDSLNLSNAITIKVTIVALVATLYTYCFKQINFYRKISEQAHQTYMELEALPEYLTHLPEEKQNEIRTDLAKRYFGQNLFESIKEDSASIQEQAKANTEVLKSTSTLLDVIKKQNG